MVSPGLHRTSMGWSAIAAIAVLPLLVSPVSAMFQRLETHAKIPCDHQLTRIQNIPYQCWQFEDPEAKLPVWKDSLGFEFGQLTQAQWTEIAIAYASWRGPILDTSVLPPFDPNKHYWLMDFMPPIMQATNRHRFISQRAPLSDAQPPTSIMANCWGTLYEILRLRQAPLETQAYLVMVDPHTILSTLNALSTPVTTPEPGDVLLISHQHPPDQRRDQFAIAPHADRPMQTYLDHAALFIDKGLIFEKAGAGDHVPYRLVGLSTVQRIWRQDVFDHQIRRPIANRAMPYPLSFRDRQLSAPTTIIADPDPAQPSRQYYSIFPLPSLVDANGRARLPQQLFDPQYYRTYDGGL